MKAYLLFVSYFILIAAAASCHGASWRDAAMSQYDGTGTISIFISEDKKYYISDSIITLEEITLLNKELQLLEDTRIVLNEGPDVLELSSLTNMPTLSLSDKFNIRFTEDRRICVRLAYLALRKQFSHITCRCSGIALKTDEFPRFCGEGCMQCDLIPMMFNQMAGDGNNITMMMDEYHARALSNALMLTGYEF